MVFQSFWSYLSNEEYISQMELNVIKCWNEII